MIINSVAQQNGKIQQGMVDMEEELEGVERKEIEEEKRDVQ
jgi:hypothetical protein